MARLFTTGFETRDTSSASFDAGGVGGFTGTVTYDTATFRSGAASLKCDSAAGNTAANVIINPNLTVATGTTIYLRAYLMFSALNASTVDVEVVANFGNANFGIWMAGTANGLGLSQGQVYLSADNHTSIVGLASAVLNLNTWYRFEQAAMIGASTNDDYVEFMLNGVSLGSTTTANAGTTSFAVQAQIGWGGSPGASKQIWVDDVAINDSTGSDQTSWPGSGKIVLLKPISDKATGANWVEGAGGTGSLFSAVKNTPPVGVAVGSATNTSQIKNVTKDTTGNYDANLTTYTTAGIAAGDTINVVHPIWNIAGSSTTSVTHAMLLVSNPAANGGAETTAARATAAATYPSQWSWQFPAAQIVYSPSPTLGTSPVIRVGKRTSTTSAAMADFMGAYVDYTPAVVAHSLVVGTPQRALAHRHNTMDRWN